MKQRDPDEALGGFRATDDAEPLDIRNAEHIRSPMRVEARESGNGGLWALCGALALALVGFAYWSHQQQTQLQQQLVATQNSFARISEEAAGRLQDVTGKLSATESSLSVAEQSRQQQLEGMQGQLTELAERTAAQTRAIESANASFGGNNDILLVAANSGVNICSLTLGRGTGTSMSSSTSPGLAFSTRMRSAKSTASSRSWVMNMIVMSRLRQICNRCFCI